MRAVWRVVSHLIEDILRPISGPLGVRLRRFYYSRRLCRCGSNLHIAPGVFLQNPEYISLGDWVWLDMNVVIIAGAANEARAVKVIENPQCKARPGEVIIGDRCHIAFGCVIQGHGGVSIGDAFTASSGSMIYSLSNSVSTTRDGPIVAAGSQIERIRTPVSIGNNVWLGLHGIVIGNSIGDDCFIRAQGIVTNSIPENSIVGGNPAQRERARYVKSDQCQHTPLAKPCASSS